MARNTRLGLSWSNSRHKKNVQCPRLMYWHHYGSIGGHRPEAAPETRLAYLLKLLVTLDMLVGGILHEFARDFAVAIRDRLQRPTLQALHQRARDRLNYAWRCSRDRDAFSRAPKNHPMLRSCWYGHEVPRATIERIQQKLQRCLENLCGSAVWDDLARVLPGEILVVDSLSAFTFEDTPVYAAPDLAYWLDEVLTIVEWKSGDDRGALEQILLYALYLRDGRGIPFDEGRWRGMIINLNEGTDASVVITQGLLDHAEERMRTSIATMKSYLADPERNIPLPRDAFPMLPDGNRKLCDSCNFVQLCERESEGWDGAGCRKELDDD